MVEELRMLKSNSKMKFPLSKRVLEAPVYLSSCIGSLSNSVFERRTSTGSGRFASLGGGLVETLR